MCHNLTHFPKLRTILAKVLLLIWFLYPATNSLLLAQETDSLVFAYPCEQTLEWAIDTILENDAAAQSVLDKKGEKAHQERIVAATVLAKDSKNIDDCQAAMTYYLHFFRRSKIGIFAHAQVDRFAKIDQSKLAKVTVDLADFEAYVANLTKPTLEGYWKIDDHLVGIKEINGEFIGFNIDVHNTIWKPKQIKLRFKLDESSFGKGKLKNVFFDELAIKHIHLADANHISVDNARLWERVRTTFPSKAQITQYVELENIKYTSLVKWNDTTFVLKIPLFMDFEAERLTKIFENQDVLLSSISHLIIDLRFTIGDGVNLDKLLFPLLYTEPIFTDAVEIRSTKLNNAFYANQFDESTLNRIEKRRLKKRIRKLNRSLNEFVSFNSLDKSLVYEQKQLAAFPKHISILTHWGNAYGVESFIELAKQSTKVQLFGTETAGSLGLTNMNNVSSPDARYTLRYATARVNVSDINLSIPYGIQPDVLFDALETPHYQWIDEVIKLRNESLK